MAEINDWDVTAANNNDTPPDGWPENTMNYAEVNDTGREGMAVVARYFQDINGSLTTGGVANAYTVTLNAGYAAYFSGMYFAAEFTATNTGASTINVNGIGVASITDRAGNALTNGELQSGGIYELRYDGTAFQLMGSVVGTTVVDSAVLTSTDAVDLTDTDNPLNIGASDPSASAHMALDALRIQAKSNGTTATTLNVNPLGGDVNVGAQTGTGSVNLYDGNDLKVETTAEGVNVRGRLDGALGATQDTRILLERTDGTNIGTVGFDNDAALTIDSLNHGANVTITAEDSGGTQRTLFTGDPDDNIALYYNGSVKYNTQLEGGDLRGSLNNAIGGTQNTVLNLERQDGTAIGRLGFDNDSTLSFESFNHGASVTISGEDAGGTAQNLLSGDPDNDVSLYYNGDVKINTSATGCDIRGLLNGSLGAAQDTHLNIERQDGTIIGRAGFDNDTNMSFKSFNHGGAVRLQGEDTGGTLRTLVDGDPDGRVDLYHDGTNMARTIAASSGGFEVNNTDTGGGFERVLTTSDIITLPTVQRLVKTSDTSRSSTTTMTDDPHLVSSTVEGSAYHRIEIFLHLDTAAAGGQFNYRLNISSGGTVGAFRMFTDANNTFTTGSSLDEQAGDNWGEGGAITLSNTSNDDPQTALIKGFIYFPTGGSDRRVALQWAQGISDPDSVTIREGSYMFIEKLADI